MKFLPRLGIFVLSDGRTEGEGGEHAAQLDQYRFGSPFLLSSSWVR